MRQAQAQGTPVSTEVVYQLPEQPPKHLLLTYAAVTEPDGRLRLGIGIARDVTAEREAARLRQEFTSLVTHELRSPLTTSVGYVDMLKRGLRRGVRGEAVDAQKALYYLDQVEAADRHLLRLVDNLLDLARVERADLPVEHGEVLLRRLVAETVRAITPQAAAKRLSVHVDVPEQLPPLWSSDLYLREMLSNLLSNAVKYTPEEGTVTVGVSVRSAEQPTGARQLSAPGPAGHGEASGRQEDAGDGPVAGGGEQEWVELAVTDTGYGMSEQEQARLFTKFFRSARPEVRQERGTGLGLALTKQMVERLGGTISVRSKLGAGSTFTVRLPLEAPPAPAERQPAAAAS